MDPYVPKMFFLKVDEDFLLYWCLIQKYLRIMKFVTLSTGDFGCYVGGLVGEGEKRV